jgi:hypothetical protein
MFSWLDCVFLPVHGDELASWLLGKRLPRHIGPQVVVVDGAQASQTASYGQIAASAVLDDFFALPSGFTGGVRVGFSAAYGSSGTPAILTGAGPGGGPEVAVFDGSTFQALSNFFFALAQSIAG